MKLERFLSRSRTQKSGQALIEYVLSIFLVLGIFSIMQFQVKRSIANLWLSLAKDIAPGCPGCTPPETMK